MSQFNGNLREPAEIKDYCNWNKRIYNFLESLKFINDTIINNQEIFRKLDENF